MRIAAVADTHVPSSGPGLPEWLLHRLKGADLILHAGDLVSLRVLDELSRIAPTVAVAGNMDPPDVKARLPEQRILCLVGRSIGLHHGHQPHSLQGRYITHDYRAAEFQLFYAAMLARFPGAALIVFGHFHAPLVLEWKGTVFINPGSIARPLVCPSYAEIELSERIDARIIERD
jgi:putative phosphoesterase